MKVADLNLCAIGLQFLQVVENYVNYNLQKFKIASSKIEPCGTHETKEFSQIEIS